MSIIKTLREIASCYTRAASELEHAAWLASTLDPSRAAGVETMIDALDREEHEPPATEPLEQAADAAAASTVSLTIDRLGWDPDTMSASDVIARVQACSLAQLLDVEALETRRGTMRPARAVRTKVISAIAQRRAELVIAEVRP